MFEIVIDFLIKGLVGYVVLSLVFGLVKYIANNKIKKDKPLNNIGFVVQRILASLEHENEWDLNKCISLPYGVFGHVRYDAKGLMHKKSGLFITYDFDKRCRVFENIEYPDRELILNDNERAALYKRCYKIWENKEELEDNKRKEEKNKKDKDIRAKILSNLGETSSDIVDYAVEHDTRQ